MFENGFTLDRGLPILERVFDGQSQPAPVFVHAFDVPHARFATVATHQIPWRLVPGRTAHGIDEQVIAQPSSNLFARWMPEIGGQERLALDNLRGARKVDDDAGQLRLCVPREEQFNAGIHAAFNADEVFIITAPIHFCGSVPVNDATVESDGRVTQRVADPGRPFRFPRLHGRVGNTLKKEVSVFRGRHHPLRRRV